jgi:hypothetical protein
MSKVWPWHSAQPGTPNIHHSNSSCPEGNKIERENRREGTGGHPLCEQCERLNRESVVGHSSTDRKPGD